MSGKSTTMSHTQDAIHQLQTEISQEKLKVGEAIKNGAIFEDVKSMTLHIKELQRQLESYLADLDPKD